MSGSVVGVVVSQLNALAVMQVDNSVPQNVNFALQVPMVINFLSVKGVTPKLGNAQNATHTLSTADVADMAKQFTVQIFCETGSSPPAQKPVVANRNADVEQQATNFVLCWRQSGRAQTRRRSRDLMSCTMTTLCTSAKGRLNPKS
jgi:hypothetical protein